MAFHGKFAGEDVYLTVLCDYRKSKPTCKLLSKDQYHRQAAMIFKGRYRSESIYWADLEAQAPGIASLSNSVRIRAGSQGLTISVSFKEGIVESISTEVKLFSLSFDIQTDWRS
ncbi:MAG: hypothetical protein M1840_006932 [Geoglossum simile]|nr:MAG: hypothetical protein M1840_006932 [Geoglossum simile]